MVWIRGENAIRRALLSVIDIATDKKKIGYFCWPIGKNEDQNPVTIKIK